LKDGLRWPDSIKAKSPGNRSGQLGSRAWSTGTHRRLIHKLDPIGANFRLQRQTEH
jgi:hypothetical protein